MKPWREQQLPTMLFPSKGLIRANRVLWSGRFRVNAVPVSHIASFFLTNGRTNAAGGLCPVARSYAFW